MKFPVASSITGQYWRTATLLICLRCASLGAQEVAPPPPPPLLTNLSQLRQAAAQTVRVVHPFQIVAQVLDVAAKDGLLALRDPSGTEFVRVSSSLGVIEPGDLISLTGTGCGVKLLEFGLAIIPGMVVDNDATHPMLVESGQARLHAGSHPLTLQWFNRTALLGLRVEMEGPGLRRQPIPNSMLFRPAAEGATNLAPGIRYQCYEGEWEFLPDFSRHRPTRTGEAANFDLSLRVRDNNVGLEFKGFIQIPEEGLYTFHLSSDDGSRLFIGEGAMNVQVLSRSPESPKAIGNPAAPGESNSRRWVTLSGVIDAMGSWHTGGELRLLVDGQEFRVEIFGGNDFLQNRPPLHVRAQVTGLLEDVSTLEGEQFPGRLLALNWKAVRAGLGPPGESLSVPSLPALPLGDVPEIEKLSTLGSAAEIKALTTSQARQQLPVSVRGVLTASSSRHWGAVLQDSTGGVFVNLADLREADHLRRGDLCLIEGVTGPGWFAPVVRAQRVTRLGAGPMPKPVRANWDQLINGSLDAEFAEVDGFLTSIRDHTLVLLTEGGKLTADLKDFQPEALCGFEGALVRIRGCFLADFDLGSRKLKPGSLTIRGAEVDVLESTPQDVFAAPAKSIRQLLLYDPKAAPFRRLKVNGQVIYNQAGECFLTDGTNGLRVTARNQDQFPVGTLVDAVGFLGFDREPIELRQAVMRQTGSAPLPAPTRLEPDQFLQASHAGTLVQVTANLINHWREGADEVLELQSRLLAFKARLPASRTNGVPKPGSVLELTGVHVLKFPQAGETQLASFGLLLSSATGIRVLNSPPWWTLQRVVILTGLLGALLCAVLLWNKELRSQVEARGHQLEMEIQKRQRAEVQQAAAAERSRIARDLHDDLGTGLTEVSLLASAGLGLHRDGEKVRVRLDTIAAKARALVSGLDFIVWAIDPRRNSLQSFADYLADHARELLAESTPDCQFRVRVECGMVSLNESERHSLFLAVKEGLNNIIRHAQATEVELRIAQAGDQLTVTLADNGRGFDPKCDFHGNGLTNLHERLRAMGGRCHIQSQPGAGTTIELVAPLAPPTEPAPPSDRLLPQDPSP